MTTASGPLRLPVHLHSAMSSSFEAAAFRDRALPNGLLQRDSGLRSPLLSRGPAAGGRADALRSETQLRGSGTQERLCQHSGKEFFKSREKLVSDVAGRSERWVLGNIRRPFVVCPSAPRTGPAPQASTRCWLPSGGPRSLQGPRTSPRSRIARPLEHASLSAAQPAFKDKAGKAAGPAGHREQSLLFAKDRR